MRLIAYQTMKIKAPQSRVSTDDIYEVQDIIQNYSVPEERRKYGPFSRKEDNPWNLTPR